MSPRCPACGQEIPPPPDPQQGVCFCFKTLYGNVNNEMCPTHRARPEWDSDLILGDALLAARNFIRSVGASRPGEPKS